MAPRLAFRKCARPPRIRCAAVTAQLDQGETGAKDITTMTAPGSAWSGFPQNPDRLTLQTADEFRTVHLVLPGDFHSTDANAYTYSYLLPLPPRLKHPHQRQRRRIHLPRLPHQPYTPTPTATPTPTTLRPRLPRQPTPRHQHLRPPIPRRLRLRRHLLRRRHPRRLLSHPPSGLSQRTGPLTLARPPSLALAQLEALLCPTSGARTAATLAERPRHPTRHHRPPPMITVRFFQSW